MKKSKIITNQQEQKIFEVTIILNVKVTAIEIKHYQLKNILTKLNLIEKLSLSNSKNLTHGKFN